MFLDGVTRIDIKDVSSNLSLNSTESITSFDKLTENDPCIKQLQLHDPNDDFQKINSVGEIKLIDFEDETTSTPYFKSEDDSPDCFNSHEKPSNNKKCIEMNEKFMSKHSIGTMMDRMVSPMKSQKKQTHEDTFKESRKNTAHEAKMKLIGMFGEDYLECPITQDYSIDSDVTENICNLSGSYPPHEHVLAVNYLDEACALPYVVVDGMENEGHYITEEDSDQNVAGIPQKIC